MKQKISLKSILKLTAAFVILLYVITTYSHTISGGEKEDNKIVINSDGRARILNKTNSVQLFVNNRKMNKDEIKFGAVTSDEIYNGIYTTQRQTEFERGGKFCVNENLHQTKNANIQALICKID